MACVAVLIPCHNHRAEALPLDVPVEDVLHVCMLPALHLHCKASYVLPKGRVTAGQGPMRQLEQKSSAALVSGLKHGSGRQLNCLVLLSGLKPSITLM